MRGLIVAMCLVATGSLSGGCSDKGTDPDGTTLRSDLRTTDSAVVAEGVEIQDCRWRMLSEADTEAGIRVEGSVDLTVINTSGRPATVSMTLTFLDGDGLLISTGALDSVMLEPDETRELQSLFQIEVGDVRTANSIKSLTMSAEVRFTGMSEACLTMAHDEWDPWDYLNWRTSTVSRHSSITHALPCSAQVVALPTSTPIAEGLEDCASAERDLYYELVGRYDQFLAGWTDVTDSDGNPVHPTEVDSVENFTSDLRLQYVSDCMGD